MPSHERGVRRLDVGRVLLGGALDVVGGRDPDADAVGADRLGDGPGDLDGEAGRGSRGEPPYSSVRSLEPGARNWWIR